jgi:hypothetical protein
MVDAFHAIFQTVGLRYGELKAEYINRLRKTDKSKIKTKKLFCDYLLKKFEE